MLSLKNTYNKISKKFDLTRYKTWDEVGDFLAELPKNSLILDFGAGNGRHSILAKKNGMKVVGADFSINQLRVFGEKEGSIPLVLGDVRNSSFKKNSFDAVLYIATIQHLPTEKQRIKSLENVKYLLKNNGKVLVSAWSLSHPRFKKFDKKKQDVVLLWEKEHPRFYHLFVDNELKKLVKKSGLKIEREFLSNHNYWIIAKK